MNFIENFFKIGTIGCSVVLVILGFCIITIEQHKILFILCIIAGAIAQIYKTKQQEKAVYYNKLKRYSERNKK